jgi:type VI protein secretion system component Hcp
MKGENDVAIVVPFGPSAPKLTEYGENGTLIPSVVIEAAGFTITLHDVVISSVQHSGGGTDGGGGNLSLTLNFRQRIIKPRNDDADKGQQKPDWDVPAPAAP